MSHFSYLTRYPLSRIKIDKDFVRNVDTSSQNTAIVRSTIIMARTMSVSTSSPRASKAGAGTLPAQRGCEEAQRFLYAQPLPRSEFEAFLRTSSAPPERRLALP